MPELQGYTLGFRDIARPTDVRTMMHSDRALGRLWEHCSLLIDWANKTHAGAVPESSLQI